MIFLFPLGTGLKKLKTPNTMNKKLKSKLIKNWIQYASLNEENLSFRSYMILFNDIPCIMKQGLNSIDKYFQELEKEFSMYQILKYSKFSHYKRLHSNKNDTGIIRLLADLKNKIMVEDDGYGVCSFLYSTTETPENVFEKYLSISESYLLKKPKPRKKGRIYILTIRGSGMKQYLLFTPFKLDKFSISIEENYTDDFKKKSDEIIKRLNVKDSNGIVILHGEAGTGKTFYLKHLCNILDKKILYIPPALVRNIVSPDFIKILSRQKNSVLIIEDADNILRKRDEMSNIQDVSSLLNITDGILHDVLKLQIVATFNIKISNIDEAFLRKGRLIAEHKFEKLNIEKAQALSDKLGFKTKIKEPMVLADIFNQDVPFFKERKQKQIGF